MANGGVLKQNAIVCHPVENDVKFYIVFHRPCPSVDLPPIFIVLYGKKSGKRRSIGTSNLMKIGGKQ
ncbi:hypothetical protein DPMN_017768 [Dreissena polymorpha]|uniref:Uncharacterized protein n=1 Tax=Dreissena polymorpha TaxID=45954 RepID=A0A9D4NFW0_DREPO|nr:hypothetical protein DPMN_017768 [Dreissena polymorpha]